MSSSISLPRKDKEGFHYLSYSQATKWGEKQRDYIRQYFFGERDENPQLQKYGDFGHKVGEAYENNDFSKWSKKEAAFLKKQPYYDEFEKEIKLRMDGYYILGYIDSNTKLSAEGYYKKILDYKTGIISKVTSKYESDDYKQLDLYAAALRQEVGRLPDEAIVVIIGRDGNAFQGEELTLSMESEIVVRDISDEKCDSVLEHFDKIANDISDYYKVYEKLNTII